MRQRTTFVHDPNDTFDPKQLHVQSDSIHVKSLKAAREDRLTLGLYELPQKVLVKMITFVLMATDFISYGEYSSNVMSYIFDGLPPVLILW